MYLYLVLGLVLIAVAVGALARTVTGQRLRTADRLGAIGHYGFSSETAAAPILPSADDDDNAVAALVRAIGDLVARYVGTASEAALRDELMAAGVYTTSPRTLLGYRVVATLILPLLGVALLGTDKPINLIAIIILFPVGWTLPLTIVRRRARDRLKQIDRQLPDLIDLLVVMIEAGMGFRAALRLAAGQFKGPLSDELRLTLQEQTMGLSTDAALANMAERADTPATRSFVRAMAQGERMGISTGQIMRKLAVEMRTRRRRDAEEQAQKAPIKMLFPLAFLIFPALFIVLMVPAVLQVLDTLSHGGVL